MANYRIASIPGDGVGQEVALEAHRMLEAASRKFDFRIELQQLDWGCDYYVSHQRMMPEDALTRLADFDAIFLGSIGDATRVPDHISVRLVLDIRNAFEQYVNLRPIKLYAGVPTEIRTATPERVNMVVVRENTEGEYATIGGIFKPDSADSVAIQSAVFTRKGCERVMRYAFETARTRRETSQGPGHVTSCTKSNALGYSMVFWDQVFGQICKDYPAIGTDSALVDALSMWLIRNPEQFDVIVCSNLFGDILTDLGAMLQGGMGMAAGGNINPERTRPSMFEPIHGSAPDIAFRGIVNPVAAIEAIRMMLQHLGEFEAAGDIEQAITKVLSSEATRTRDLRGSASTREVGDAIINKFNAI